MHPKQRFGQRRRGARHGRAPQAAREFRDGISAVIGLELERHRLRAAVATESGRLLYVCDHLPGDGTHVVHLTFEARRNDRTGDGWSGYPVDPAPNGSRARHQAFGLRGPAQTLHSSGWSRRASDSAIKASPSAGERLLLTSPR